MSSQNNVETVKCRYCYADIDKRAKICPFCRKKQKKSKVGAVIFLIFLLIVAAVVGVIGAGTYSRYKLTEHSRTMSADEFKDQCKVVTYDELMRSEDALKGQDVTLKGTILQVVGENTYRLAIDKPGESFSADAVLIRIPSNSDRIIEDDVMIIYGTSMGFESYTGLLGQSVTVPYIYVAYYDTIIK